MSGSVVYKMSGSGNDFVFIDGRSESLEDWPPERIRAVCARRTGIGADGFVVLGPGSSPGVVRFHFFNSDGSHADMCGNAALCATRMACWLELGPADGMVLETDAGAIDARCLTGPGERAEIVLPSTGGVTVPDIGRSDGERGIFFTTVGVPHLVVPVDDLPNVPILDRGRELRAHPALGDGGANVNFVSQGSGGWGMRTFERGVEGETLACGTGAVASAAVLAHEGAAQLPLELSTASGVSLQVAADLGKNGRLERPRLVGEGRMIYRAVLGG